MSGYRLADFGGKFLTNGRNNIGGKTYPDISAYVEWFMPENARDVSVTFVHGGGGQGSEFLRTPDGRPGWAHTFVQAGYSVFILDRPGHGRNAWNPSVLGPALPPPDYDTIYPRFVEPAAHQLWPKATLHNKWPADSDAGDRFMASQGPMADQLRASQRHVEAIAAELFRSSGRTILLTHSAGGPCGWALAALGGDAVAAIIAIEPLGYPGFEHAQGRFTNGLTAAPFAGESDPYDRPIAIVTGEASWMQEANTKAAAFLSEQGYTHDHIRLEEHGIRGNGHMMMSETNSDDIASLLLNWLEQRLWIA